MQIIQLKLELDYDSRRTVTNSQIIKEICELLTNFDYNYKNATLTIDGIKQKFPMDSTIVENDELEIDIYEKILEFGDIN